MFTLVLQLSRRPLHTGIHPAVVCLCQHTGFSGVQKLEYLFSSILPYPSSDAGKFYLSNPQFKS